MSDMIFMAEPLASTPTPAGLKKRSKALKKGKRSTVKHLMRLLRRVNNIDSAERIRAEKLDYAPWQFANAPYVKGCLNALIDRCEEALKE